MPYPTTPDAPALDIRSLRFRYPDQSAGAWTVAVDALALRRGEQVLLTAGSGRGKSTLLHLIAGLMDPAEGDIRVAGESINRLPPRQRDLHRGRTIGMIFQTFNLLHGFSALENVMAAMMFSAIPPREHRPRALALLKHLGIDRPDADPDRLSVGQQQRVAVARAVACDPVLLLADEPTASLDPENASGAIELIRAVAREKNAALLCVSHDPAMKDHFERRITLEELAGNTPQPASA
ncbi:MAG: ABC transporter ATP-binding protein [Planctomycetes bacterium]|nr:ABC transporter ATP-binding protein [Planctomycetota bacterium]